MTVTQFLAKLDGVRRNGPQVMARCPAHEDRNPSLSISESDGKTLLKCHAGCETSAIVEALGLKMSDLFADTKGNSHSASERIVATYDYRDEAGKLLFQVVRYEPKAFKQRRPDGKGGWIWNLDGVRRVLYRLPEVIKADSVLICEGEKDCDTAARLGLVATCNPHGAGKWKPGYSEPLRGKRVTAICDADAPGVAHGRDVARSLMGIAASAKLIEALPQAKDLSEWVAKGGTRDSLLSLIQETPEVQAANAVKDADARTLWAAAESMATFLAGDEADAEFLDDENCFLARECVTEIFSPRGLGKSLFALWLALRCAGRGSRVLYLDRDNPKRVVKNRLRAFGATPEMGNLRLIPREKCPPLTNATAWASFPYNDYDVVILDSLDSAAEGIGEQDSAKPSKAIAPLLDIARRENGPAVLILGNTIKSAQHSRGSGIIEDRADIVYEVRDASDFHPSGSKPWIEELPRADAGSWVGRASRRKQRERYRLAFVASKFRIAEEAETRTQRAREKAETVQKAVDSLTGKISRRAGAAGPDILKKEAEEFLTLTGITQKIAREALKSPAFELVDLPGKGHPKAVRLACKNEESNRNRPLAEPASIQAENGADFGCPDSMHPTEIGPPQTRINGGCQRPIISVEDSLFTPQHGQENGPDDAEVL